MVVQKTYISINFSSFNTMFFLFNILSKHTYLNLFFLFFLSLSSPLLYHQYIFLFLFSLYHDLIPQQNSPFKLLISKKQIYLINQAHKTLFSIFLIKMRKIKAIAKRQQQSIQIRQLNVSVLNLPLYCTNTIPIVQSKANHSSLLCAILQIQVILVIKCCWKHVIAEHISIQLFKISIRFHFESTGNTLLVLKLLR